MGGGEEADDSNARPHEQSQHAARPRASDTELAIEVQRCPLPPPSIARPSKVSDKRARFSHWTAMPRCRGWAPARQNWASIAASRTTNLLALCPVR